MKPRPHRPVSRLVLLVLAAIAAVGMSSCYAAAGTGGGYRSGPYHDGYYHRGWR